MTYLFSPQNLSPPQQKGIFSRSLRYIVLILLTVFLIEFAHGAGNQVNSTTVESPIQEQILSFNSDVTVKSNGSMVVEETITIQASGEQIKRGIYRDFPLTSPFHREIVPFEVLTVFRDGKTTPYWVENRGQSQRINIYKEDVYIEPGIYTYSITYRTDKQLDFSDPNSDRLYWNVNGQDWVFAIKEVRATVHLPVVS